MNSLKHLKPVDAPLKRRSFELLSHSYVDKSLMSVLKMILPCWKKACLVLPLTANVKGIWLQLMPVGGPQSRALEERSRVVFRPKNISYIRQT